MFSLKSYFVFLGRNKAYTAINLVGFSVALVFVILLGLYVADESSADNFHSKSDRIFRLIDEYSHSRWPVPIGGDVAGRYPEVESYVRTWIDMASVAPAENDSWESFRTTALVTDPEFFSMFDFPLVAGDRERQLQTADDVVISHDIATRLFSSPEAAIGKPILIDRMPYIVTGVVGDFGKSHLATPGVMLNFNDTVDKWYRDSGYSAANFQLYLLVREGADLHPKMGEMAEWFKTFFWVYKNGMSTEVVLEPVRESFFNNGRANENVRSGDRQLIWLLGIATMTILLFAMINYINLSVALSGFRAREAATRRLLGGTKWQLFGSYVAESVMFCVVAFVIAFALASVVQGVFNGVLDSDVSVGGALADPGVVALCVGLALLLGAVSGVFPAMVVSRYKPIEVVRGEMVRKTKMTYSRLFIGLQFLLTIVLIGCAITIRRQTDYMLNKDLGFHHSQLVMMENSVFAQNVPGLRERLLQIPGVERVAFTQGHPLGNGNNTTVRREDVGKNYSVREFMGDEGFLDLFEIEIASRTGNMADSAVWLNETAMRLFELTPDDPKLPFRFNEMEAVAGTVRDFHVDALTTEIRPVIIRPLQKGTGEYIEHPYEIFVKIDTSDPAAMAATVDEVKRVHSHFGGGRPFETKFVDDVLQGWYETYRSAATMVGWFSMLALVLSAMGLVAMATYFMRQRAREIAVRKVFGSTSREVLERLVGGFLRIVAVAFVLAIPVIFLLMSRWLTTFAYRIPLSWTIFALAALIAAVIAIGAVMWQSLRAANTNPVETLHKG